MPESRMNFYFWEKMKILTIIHCGQIEAFDE